MSWQQWSLIGKWNIWYPWNVPKSVLKNNFTGYFYILSWNTLTAVRKFAKKDSVTSVFPGKFFQSFSDIFFSKPTLSKSEVCPELSQITPSELLQEVLEAVLPYESASN